MSLNLNEEFEYSSKTDRVSKNIKSALSQTLKNVYGITDELKNEEISSKLLKIHGLSPAHFDFVKNVEMSMSAQFKQDTVAGDVDPNSNKSSPSIKQIYADAQAPFQKATGYDYLYRTMKTLYGKDEAKRLSGEMYSYALALSDSTQILSIYCYAADFSKLIIEGRPWGTIHSAPAKRVDSYVQQVLETVHEMSTHLAGAIAISTLFFDIAHLIMYKDGVCTSLKKVSLDDIKNDVVVRKTLENIFQTIIHSVNHTSRNGCESPFTNVSIFDRHKIRAIIDTIPHMFIDDDILYGEDKYSYIIDMVSELQNIYMSIFEKGNQLSDNRPVTFPVTTINMTKKDDTLVEPSFVKYISQKELYRYNINVSEGNRVAMCCRFSNDYDLMREQAKTINSFGGEGIAIGSHRVNTIGLVRVAMESNSVEHFKIILENRVHDNIKILKAHKELIKFTTEKNMQKFVTNGWIDLNNLFSTVGIIGCSEMARYMSAKFGDDMDYIEYALTIIESSVEKYSREYGIYGNIEEIPGESLATKLPKADKLIYGEDGISEILYSNQFIPLWADATIYERMEADGRYQKMLTGGGIVHFQIGGELTPIQYTNLINDAVKAGCEHFAANTVTCLCENGHSVIGDFNVKFCTLCDAPIVSQITRIAGFHTEVFNWNEIRRTWEAPRRITYQNNKI